VRTKGAGRVSQTRPDSHPSPLTGTEPDLESMKAAEGEEFKQEVALRRRRGSTAVGFRLGSTLSFYLATRIGSR
jgi:hypothetical protein